MKTKRICVWCGKDHKGKLPKACRRDSLLMTEVCRHIEPWKVMYAIERHGRAVLEVLAHELELTKPRSTK